MPKNVGYKRKPDSYSDKKPNSSINKPTPQKPRKDRSKKK